MVVRDSDKNNPVTLIRNSFPSLFSACIGITLMTESEIFAPFDLESLELGSKENEVLTRNNLMPSKCFSNLKTALSK